ncbi:MAG: hypothetical protein A2W08_19355 [Candidatus Rokubacteria bacterium RBG_16_73_20]|nr:MAG: hypothetical protein A2050_14120 [Candidatus Rokubacteria bacterium GWA2_73_35]OGK91397.1 MAG: hypothetical protein A2W08_19355 [Candidatus Rokubacteria bacterium RBG_16_73_20]
MRPVLRALLPTAAAVLLLALGIVWLAEGPGATASPADAPTPGTTREVAIRAQAWGFRPRVVRVAPGETLRLAGISEDIQHGLAINDLGVNLQLRAGQVARSPAVTVNLPEGVYTIQCSVFCGLGHASMKAKLVVGSPRAAPGSGAPWIASLLGLAVVVGVAFRAGRPRG